MSKNCKSCFIQRIHSGYRMSETTRVKVDMSQFIDDSKQLLGKDWPEAVAKALQLTAKRVDMMEKANTRQTFKLHTDWIPKNIQPFPRTSGQTKRVANDIRTKHEAFASVSTSEKISYMPMHEFGATKTPRGSALAIPGVGGKKRRMVGATGRTKDRWKPKNLLSEFNKSNWEKGSKHPGERGAGRKLPFVIKTSSGLPLLVRRRTKKSGPLETLYVFKESAKIKADWKFEEKGYAFVKQNYEKYFEYSLRVIVEKYGK